METNLYHLINAAIKKYRLTPRQVIQVRQIVMTVVSGKSVIYVQPRLVGSRSVYDCTREILLALGENIKKLAVIEA